MQPTAQAATKAKANKGAPVPGAQITDACRRNREHAAHTQMADELGALEKEYALALAPLEMKLPRIKALKEALQAACPAPPDKEWVIEGLRFGVKLGPRANQRLIDFKALVKKIGAAAFVKFATCTLGALEEHASPDVVNTVVTSEQTGPRKLTTFEKGAA